MHNFLELSEPARGVAPGATRSRLRRLMIIAGVFALSFSGSVFAASLVAGSLNSGGGQASSANYSMDTSLGELVSGQATGGTVTLTSGGPSIQPASAKSLALNVTPASCNEGSTSQLSGSAIMEDDSSTLLSGNDISWSLVNGPIIAISASGLATTDAVYANKSAGLAGHWMGAANTATLLVLNNQLDNYHGYASDGLPDDWQVQYFGETNSLAAPLLDPDGDGQNNLFEFTAGLVPTDPNSRFLLRIAAVAGQTGQKQIIFAPRFQDRNYSILTTTNLPGGSWTPLTGGITSDSGTERTVTDTNTIENRKFYRVGVVKP